jgi:hypothetical protein
MERSMLVIMIDLVPGGYESYRHTIGSMRIANRSNLADTSDYSVEVMEAANHLTGAKSRNATRPGSSHKEGIRFRGGFTAMESVSRLTGHSPGIAECEVADHSRRQRVWALIQRACEEIMKADWVEL